MMMNDSTLNSSTVPMQWSNQIKTKKKNLLTCPRGLFHHFILLTPAVVIKAIALFLHLDSIISCRLKWSGDQNTLSVWLSCLQHVLPTWLQRDLNGVWTSRPKLKMKVHWKNYIDIYINWPWICSGSSTCGEPLGSARLICRLLSAAVLQQHEAAFIRCILLPAEPRSPAVQMLLLRPQNVDDAPHVSPPMQSHTIRVLTWIWSSIWRPARRRCGQTCRCIAVSK